MLMCNITPPWCRAGMMGSLPVTAGHCFTAGLFMLTVIYVIVKPWLLSHYKIYLRWSIVPLEGRRPKGGTIDHRGYIL